MVCGAVSSGQSPPLLSTSNVTMLGAASVSSANFAQSWQLDATGNWPQFRQLDTASSSNNLDQQRASNAANELMQISQRYGTAWAQPGYDRAGNMTQIPSGIDPTVALTGIYDAWNRLVSASTGEDSTTYAYDGLNRRITKTVDDAPRDFYVSTHWQILEERIDGSTDPDRQFVWGLRYVNDLVLRDRLSSGDLEDRCYGVQDANWNVTAIIGTDGSVLERYRYSPYGVVTFLSAGVDPRDYSVYDWETLYAGYRYDVDTGFYYVNWRYLQALIGLWLTKDPLGFRTGTNPFEYVGGSPLKYVDAFGLFMDEAVVGIGRYSAFPV